MLLLTNATSGHKIQKKIAILPRLQRELLSLHLEDKIQKKIAIQFAVFYSVEIVCEQNSKENSNLICEHTVIGTLVVDKIQKKIAISGNPRRYVWPAEKVVDKIQKKIAIPYVGDRVPRLRSDA